MSFLKNVMSHPLPFLALNLFDEHQFSSKDNMIFGQGGGIRNMILFMLDTCIIFSTSNISQHKVGFMQDYSNPYIIYVK